MTGPSATVSPALATDIRYRRVARGPASIGLPAAEGGPTRRGATPGACAEDQGRREDRIRKNPHTRSELAAELDSRFEEHPDAKIIRSLPGLGPVPGARALGEFGDALDRHADAKARKNYATTSPVTRASGKLRLVVARRRGIRRLGEVCLHWAFGAIHTSPGARAYYDSLRARRKTRGQGLRTAANRLVGILHACLAKRVEYDEVVARPAAAKKAA